MGEGVPKSLEKVFLTPGLADFSSFSVCAPVEPIELAEVYRWYCFIRGVGCVDCDGWQSVLGEFAKAAEKIDFQPRGVKRTQKKAAEKAIEILALQRQFDIVSFYGWF